MLLDFLTLLYIFLFGGGLVLILVIIRYLRNEVWVATVDDGISHYYGVLKKDGGSGAAQVFWAGDTSEPAIGQVQYKDSVGQVLIKRDHSGTGKNHYKKVGYVDDNGYLYRYGKNTEEPERIGYLAAPSAPNVPTIKGERTWRDLWWSCKLNAYLGNPEDYIAPPAIEGKKKEKGGEGHEKNNLPPERKKQNVSGESEAPVNFASERIAKEGNPHLNASLIQEIETALKEAKADLEKELTAADEISPEPIPDTEPGIEPDVEPQSESEQFLEPEVQSETIQTEHVDSDTPPVAVQESVVPEEPITPEEEAQLNRILENHQDIVEELISQLILVEGGSFMMGADGPQDNVPEDNIGYGVSENEGPVHRVTLSDYFIGKYPVTQRQWTAVMGYNPSENQENPLFPVAPVNWDECSLFVKRMKRLTGLDISLPTEAQWEYAARGGKNQDGFIYSGSDQFSEVGCDSPYYEVGSKKPNSLGIYDMSGLVREWCGDWYEIHYSGNDQVNPKGPDSPPVPEEPRRVVRSPRGNDTVTNRKGELPTELPFKSYGLRIVCNSDLPQVVHSIKDTDHFVPDSVSKKRATEQKPMPPILVGQGIKTGWFSGNTPGCPLTLESRAASFSALYGEKESYSEHLSEGIFTWKDTALFSSLVFANIFLMVYFVNVGILEYPLLGNDLKAILVFSAFYFVIWAVVRMFKVYSIEDGRSIQPFFTLFNKFLGVKKIDLFILILSVVAVPLCFFKFDADFIPLFIALILGTGINRTIRKNGRKWEVRNPLSATQMNEDDEGLYDPKTSLLHKPEGDVPVEYQWKLQSFSPEIELDCFVSFWYDRELIEAERIMNPFYMENPRLRNRPSIFKAYVGKMIQMVKTRPEMVYHLKYVIQEISRLANRNNLSEIDRLQIVLDFAQQAVSYVKDDESKTISKPFVYVRFPDESLFDQEGDCNCKAFLAGSMYYLMGYDVLYASSTKLGHTLIGLKLPPELLEQNGIVMNNDNTLEYNNSRYILCETTHAGFKIGMAGESDSASSFDVVVEFIHENDEE